MLGLSICNDKTLCKAKRSPIIEDVPFERGKEGWGGGGIAMSLIMEIEIKYGDGRR